MGREGGGGVAPWGARDRPGLIRRDLQEQAELHIYAHTRRRRRRLQVQEEKKKKIAEVTSLLFPPEWNGDDDCWRFGREWPKKGANSLPTPLYTYSKKTRRKKVNCDVI